MAITPADIENMTFSQAGKHDEGYKTEEVDVFLDQVASEVDAMLQKIADLKGRLTTSEQQLAAAQAQIAQLKEQESQSVSAVPVAPAVPASGLTASEEQISKVLIVAQQSADKLVADARTNAENIRNEADQKAREVIRQALAEKQNELDEIDRLKQSREDFRTEYKKLLQHFMDDADSVFPQQTLSTPNGSKGTTHTDSYVTPAQVQPAKTTAPADAEATTYAPAPAANDFSDLD